MLEFKKTTITKTGSETTTIVTLINDNLLGTRRFVNSRLCTIHVEIDGTTKDFAKKVQRLVELSNDLYEEFSRIQKETRDVN